MGVCSQQPFGYRLKLSFVPTMSAASSSDSRDASVSSPWKLASPEHMDSNEYVQSLTRLGYYIAKRVPTEVADGAITCMQEAPTRPLLEGNFVSKQTVKQDTLLPRCFQLSFVCL